MCVSQGERANSTGARLWALMRPAHLDRDLPAVEQRGAMDLLGWSRWGRSKAKVGWLVGDSAINTSGEMRAAALE